MGGIAQWRGGVGHAGEIGTAVEIQQMRRRAENHGHERRRAHGCKRCERTDIVGHHTSAGSMAYLVIDYHQTERLAAWGSELVLIDFTEYLAGIEFGGAFQIAANLAPCDRQQAGLDLVARFDAAYQPAQPTPRAFEALQPWVVQDRIELCAYQGVNGGNVAINRAAQCVAITPYQTVKMPSAEP